MAHGNTVTCEIRYTLAPGKLAEFEAYARAWMRLIERYGGTHHGYFVPSSPLGGARISFPGVGSEGPADVAIALFSFPDDQSYQRYRELVAADPECHSAEALYRESLCFVRYERLFLQSVDREV